MAAKLVTTIKRFTGTAAEKAALDLTGVPIGSTYLQTDDVKGIYVLDSSGAWVLKEDAVSLTGSSMDLRGTAANKPLATAVTIGATYWSVDTDPGADTIEVSDGTNWVVI
jgi:hypothetical protein